MTDAAWDELALPINLAFLFHSTPAGRTIAMYPGPAGATESLLSLNQWESLTAANAPLRRMAADVEALLVNRLGTTRVHYVAPIDLCFELVGTIRMHWRGFSGGEKVWREINQFFERLAARSAVEKEEEKSGGANPESRAEHQNVSGSPTQETVHA
jgi:hypothetical protein